jgi:hypothetical protein
MEQDMSIYYKKYKNANKKIEEACHLMTCKYISYLYDHMSYALDIDPVYMEVYTPSVTSFVDLKPAEEKKKLENIDSIFYTISHPLDKALYYWDDLLGSGIGDYLEIPNFSITNMAMPDKDGQLVPIDTIIARFFIGPDKEIKSMYIKYAGKWCDLDSLLNIPRTIILIQDNHSCDDYSLFTRVGFIPDMPNSCSIDIRLDPKKDGSVLNVVSRLDPEVKSVYHI